MLGSWLGRHHQRGRLRPRPAARRRRQAAYTALRHNLGRTILLGLEVLIVADIILTVAIDQTLESAATLGLIVLVRTFLSFSLDIEMDGVVPWRRHAVERAAGAVTRWRAIGPAVAPLGAPARRAAISCRSG